MSDDAQREEAEQRERLRDAEAHGEQTLERAEELEREGAELDRTRPQEPDQ